MSQAQRQTSNNGETRSFAGGCEAECPRLTSARRRMPGLSPCSCSLSPRAHFGVAACCRPAVRDVGMKEIRRRGPAAPTEAELAGKTNKRERDLEQPKAATESREKIETESMLARRPAREA